MGRPKGGKNKYWSKEDKKNTKLSETICRS